MFRLLDLDIMFEVVRDTYKLLSVESVNCFYLDLDLDIATSYQ